MYHPYYTWGNDGSAPVSTIPMGGAGYPAPHNAWKRRSLWEKVSKWVEQDYKDLYMQVTAEDMPPEVKKEAAKVVKPFAERLKGIPPPAKVDWTGFKQNEEAIARLLALYEEQETNRKLKVERRRELERILLKMIL